ncbi:MAG: DUF2163 domain-containing protein [Pseudomonadota bacterium]
MKALASEMIDRLASNVRTHCLCWRLVRPDEVVFGLTDHDRALEIEAMRFDPGVSLSAGRFTKSIELRPGHADVEGALASELITAEDLKAGLWDGCRVEIYRADWARAELGLIHLWSGYFSEISVGSAGRFEARLVSLKADLERPIGRVIQRGCDAVLGDARCTIAPMGRTCDGRFETCRDVFNNVENFQGFPHMPGNDFVLSGPAADGNDGGKR